MTTVTWCMQTFCMPLYVRRWLYLKLHSRGLPRSHGGACDLDASKMNRAALLPDCQSFVALHDAVWNELTMHQDGKVNS